MLNATVEVKEEEVKKYIDTLVAPYLERLKNRASVNPDRVMKLVEIEKVFGLKASYIRQLIKNRTQGVEPNLPYMVIGDSEKRPTYAIRAIHIFEHINKLEDRPCL